VDTERVVIGVDFSGAMMRAAPWVRSYIAPGNKLVLVHAAERTDIPPFLHSLIASDDEFRARDLDAAETRLREWRDAAGLCDARIVVREGRADEVLRAVTHETGAELTVIGAHAGRKRPWLRLGTTAERLLRAAESSLLVIRGTMTGAPRRILVALDDATITPRTLATAGSLADRFNARLHAVHVLSNAAYSHLLSMEGIESHNDDDARMKLEADIANEALRWLKALWCKTSRHGKLEIDIAHGVPGDEILRAAEGFAADLIVIGRYGVGRVVPAILGSVVGSVVHGANCPVLVVADPAPRA
jgi:nucleotide-binding universal stress UspA family protein